MLQSIILSGKFCFLFDSTDFVILADSFIVFFSMDKFKCSDDILFVSLKLCKLSVLLLLNVTASSFS